jgi:hypothetical protein
MTFDYMNNDRDATKSNKGYEMQFMTFMLAIVENIHNITYTFAYEGYEDYDINIQDKPDSLIQVKFHNLNSTTKEHASKDSGFYKVYKNFIDKYDKLKHVRKIVYMVITEGDTINTTYNLIHMNNEKLYNLLRHKYNKIYKDDSLLRDFCNKIEIKTLNNTTINDMIAKITSIISNIYSDFADTNNSTIIYDANILYAILSTRIRGKLWETFLDDRKITIDSLRKSILDDIKNNKITIDGMLDIYKSTITNMHKDDISKIINSHSMTTIISLCMNSTLQNKTKLLKILRNAQKMQSDILENEIIKLRVNIHTECIQIFAKILNDNPNMNIEIRSPIARNITQILSEKKYTIKIHKKILEYSHT